MVNQIIQGDVLDCLKNIPDESVQCVVTSPPYWGLRDYGTATWEGGDKDCPHLRESKKSDKTITGHKNFDKMNGVGDAIYKTKCLKCGAIRKDKQLGLESSPEEFVDNLVKVFREVKRVLKDDGTLWLNLGDSYYRSGSDQPTQRGLLNTEDINQRYGFDKKHKKSHDVLKSKDLIGIPWKVAFALQADGWYLRQDIIWHKPNPMPESVKDRCTKSHEYIFLLSKSERYFYDANAIKEKSIYPDGPTSPNKIKAVDGVYSKNLQKIKGNEYRNKRSVWKITTKPYKEAHFATFPKELPELCIKAGSKEEDIVLDPFFGSGTTGWVAQRLGRKWLGIELNPEYIKIAEKRFLQQELFM